LKTNRYGIFTSSDAKHDGVGGSDDRTDKDKTAAIIAGINVR
jgi:hypothetical protein